MSYRSSYVSYKSNLPTSSYKSGSTSAYSSRDDISANDGKQLNGTPRFGTLATPSAFRPSYSSGNYRSVPVKREPAYSTPYISRYSSASNVNNDKEKTTIDSTKIQNKYSRTNSSNAGLAASTSSSCNHKISRYSSTSTGNLSRYGGRSRDPSPANDRRLMSRVKSREPSPSPMITNSGSLRARSRDPSPAMTDRLSIGSATNKLNSTAMNYPTYRMGCRQNSGGFNSRFGHNNSSSLPRSKTPTLAERALSYMTANEMRGRVKQRREILAAQEKEAEEIEKANTLKIQEEIEKNQKESELHAAVVAVVLPELEVEPEKEPEVFISLKVITRGTSPTPPGSATFVRVRRIDLAKTVEKTIQKSTRKLECAEKGIQSDRLDDSTKYSRFVGNRITTSPWSLDTSKFSSGSSKYSVSSASSPSRTSNRSENTDSEKSKKDESSNISSNTSRASGNRSSSKKESTSKTTSSDSPKSKLFLPKVMNTSKQKSQDNSINSTTTSTRSSLPPTCPKNEMSTKSSNSTTTTTTTNSGGAKLPNKDFRKSALNVGPTDRPRKSRTPSTSTDTEENQSKSGSAFVNGTIQYVQRLERSPSIGSEASNTSTTTSSSFSNDQQQQQENAKHQRCHQPKIKTSQILKQTTAPTRNSHNQEMNSLFLENKKIIEFGTGTNNQREANSGCNENFNSENLVTGMQIQNNSENKSLSPQLLQIQSTVRTTPTTPPQHQQAISTATSLLKYLQINNSPADSPLTSERKIQQIEPTTAPLQTQTHRSKNDDEENENYLIRKLGSVSNFLIARVQQDSDSEQIYFDNTSSSNSISNGFKQDVSIVTSTPTKFSKIPLDKSDNNNSNNNYNNDSNRVTTNNNNLINKSSDTTKNTIKITTNRLFNDDTVTEIATKSPSIINKSSDGTIDLEESSWWLDTNQQINTESALDIEDTNMKFKLRHIDSGEVAWWLRDDSNNPQFSNGNDGTIDEDLKTYNEDQNTENLLGKTSSESAENSSAWWVNQNAKCELYNNNNNVKMVNSRQSPWQQNSRNQFYDDETSINDDSQESAWWQKENYHTNPEQEMKNVNRCVSEPPWLNKTTNIAPNSNNYNGTIDNKTMNTVTLNKIQRIQSGEKPWWLEENSKNSHTKSSKNNNSNNCSTNNENSGSYKLQRIPTNDKPWYLASPTKKLLNVRRIESGEKAWWLQDNPVEENVEKETRNSDSSDSDNDDDDDQEITHHIFNDNYNYKNNLYNHHQHNHQQSQNNNKINCIEPPLGDRASPEGLEDDSNNSRKSIYDNIPSKNNLSQIHDEQQQQQKIQQQQQQQTNVEISLQKLFISRHTNIDEILGTSCRPMSPILDRIMANKLCFEEMPPVRVHDSTAQIAIIQRIDRNDWEDDLTSDNNNYNNNNNYSNLDDAALQVYKDGDFGAYLDLESSLAEQSEEIEGVNSSRKNSIVVRTQLSVRVHAIIEKLLSSEGTELRRALFSLKQIFQEDKDLVHGFVALGGLNCLVRVGNGADQNYQNCILRALGQVMLYVDGMNGVMKHGPTIQWLYSLISSKYRLVVKTALKLLLVFVEYVESNCYLLVNAIHTVDIAQGALPWTNIMRLMKDYENADTELLIYATSLINKTLSGLSDQDSFYDESDLLEQQGMEGVIQRYMSRPGTDLDLLDQLQLYESVLKFEDGETDGIRLPDSSVRKTLRYRTSTTDSTERRKSRRHSTGTSPLNKNLLSPKHFTPNTNGILDEDSSSSSNSNEYTNGVFRDSKSSRESPGVTPGLRRRRERAERQKSFMREQQEATLNGGIRSPPFGNKDDSNSLGQLVTAMPVQLNNFSDSPPESLTSTTPSPLLLTSTPKTSTTNSNRTSSGPPPFCPPPPSATFSPTKSLLTNTSISVITNGFDKIKITNGSSSISNGQTVPPDRFSSGHLINLNNNNNNNNNNINNNGSTEFMSNKNLVMRSMNGIIKNIQRNENLVKCDSNENLNNNNINSLSNHKKFENESNRLNNYYSQLNSPIKTTILCQKNVKHLTENNNNNNSNNSNSPIKLQNQQNVLTTSPNHCNSNGYTNGHVNQQPQQLQQITTVSNRLINSKQQQQQKELQSNSQSIPQVNGNSVNGNCGGGGGNNVICQSSATLTNVNGVSNNTKTLDGNVNTIGNVQYVTTQDLESELDEKRLLLHLKRDHTVKDLTQKLSSLPTSPQEDKPQNRMGDMTGLISKAKEGLAKSKSKGEISRSPSVDQEIKKVETKKSENELHWEELMKNITRPLNLCDLDFTDLNSEDEKDVLAPRGLGVGCIPPPPPPYGMPPPPNGMFGHPPPPLMNLMPPPPTNLIPPPMFKSFNQSAASNGFTNGNSGPGDTNTIKKNKKTVKLFWKEVREDMIPMTIGKTIWDELPQANVDIQKLEHLFESRAKDLNIKKQQELNKSKEIIVLDHKRSNAINIAMTKLPPPRAIKAAILKMDATVVTREGIDKLMNMLPTDEERGKIQEAQMSNPELPLGSAEQFLLTLSSISELAARLKLWSFKLDFENSEKEIAEPLMDLKQGLELLKLNRTFKCILSTLLSVGIFLNGAPVKGFQIEYLAKVPEVKDTVHKHSLLHHLCHMVMESSPDTTDLYSEIGPITRASKADYADLAHNLIQLETECKASWDRLKLIAKHDCPPQLKQKLIDFLADCAERIIILQIVHRRVINRYRKFLLWLGVPQHRVAESRPNEFCRILSEFALEYRTTRERVQQQIEKKANHRERNKTRGKMIIDIPKFRTKEDRADAELKQLLGTPSPTSENLDGTLTWRRRRAVVDQMRSPILKNPDEQFTDGDDEILESLVKTATKTSGARPTPRERKRTRHADRKSLRRTLKNGLTEEEKQHIASLITTY